MIFSKFLAKDLKEIEPTLPQLDVVTVENCFYYLSLLEQFTELLNKFKDHLDAFHARAELRYIAWVETADRRSDWPIVPPLDVAYMMHAHLLSPHRYYEDCHRIKGKSPASPLPLKELHQCRFNNGLPDSHSTSHWNFCSSVALVEPYQLECKDLEAEFELSYKCSNCNYRLIMTWKEYGRWRANPQVSYKCGSCAKTVTSHERAVHEFINDIKFHGTAHASDFAYIRGTMLDENGKLKTVFDPIAIIRAKEKSRTEALAAQMAPKSKNIFKRFSSNKNLTEEQSSPAPLSATDQLVANSIQSNALPRAMMADFVGRYAVRTSLSMEDIGQLFVDSFDTQQIQKEYTDKQKDEKKAKLRELAYVLDRYYSNNPSIFSVDLIMEAKRQCLMANRLLKATWRFPESLVLGIRQYKEFLGITRHTRHRACQPSSFAVHLAWHVHMMHPLDYHTFTTNRLGTLVEHDDSEDACDTPANSHQEQHQKMMDLAIGQSMQIVLRSSRERPPLEFVLSETDYRHGTIDVSTFKGTSGTLPSLGDTSKNFDSLPYIKDPDVKNAIQYGWHLSPSPKDLTIVTKLIPIKTKPVVTNVYRPTTSGNRVKAGGRRNTGRGGGGYSSNGAYDSYAGYNAINFGSSGDGSYSSCGAGHSSSGYGGGHSSSGCGGGASSSGCGGGGSSGCGGGGCGGGGCGGGGC